MLQPDQRFDGRFDLAIIGAGMYGASLASLAARNGLKTLLLERGDFGAGVSANSLKVIHGGLRYLQHLDLRRMRASIAARSLLLRIAPDLVKPRGFVMPLRPAGLRSRPAMRVALAVNELVSADRNRGLDRDHAIPSARLIRSDELSAQFPGVALPAHRGGALWFDAVAEDTERLTLAFALDAEAAGAVIANYTRAVSLVQQGESVTGLEVEDVDTGDRRAIEARHVVWTGGAAWSSLVAGRCPDDAPAAGWVRAVNLVLDLPWSSSWGLAVPATAEGVQRNLFFVPWRGKVMAGTWYQPCTSGEAGNAVTSGELDGWLDEVRGCFPSLAIDRRAVTMVHAGVLPALARGSAEPARTVRIRTGPAHGLPADLTLVQGVKYTTGPLVAAETLRGIAGRLGATMRVAGWREPLAAAVAAPSAWTEADVRRCCELEHGRHLADLVLRRLALGTAGMPDAAELDRLSRAMAKVRGWTEAARERELDALRAHYRRLGLVECT